MEKYTFIRELGEGNFGRVGLFESKENGLHVAIKSVKLNSLSEKQKQDALNEIRLLASIKNPYVIKYFDSFYETDANTLFIVMEYADGGDIEHKIRTARDDQTGGFPETYIWKIAYELLEGLQYLHASNIVHRDIKAGNVFICNNLAKLGDFNISKLSEKSVCSTHIGTPIYMSPQVWNGEQYNQKCDIWSLGCLLYQLCTLQPPFSGNSIPSIFRKITTGVYQKLSDSYSTGLRQLIYKCLTMKAKERPNAAEMLNSEILQGMREGLRKSLLGGKRMVSAIHCPEVVAFLMKSLSLQEAKEVDSKKNTLSKKEDTKLLKGDPKVPKGEQKIVKGARFAEESKPEEQEKDAVQDSMTNGTKRRLKSAKKASSSIKKNNLKTTSKEINPNSTPTKPFRLATGTLARAKSVKKL